MKQNSSILFHHMRKSLIFGYLRIFLCAVALLVAEKPLAAAAERPEYIESFDPAKGFKPAQRDLTEVFLQLAGSLEHFGSPEPYLRHMAAEHTRIEALYRAKFGKDPKSYRPAYMTDAYLDRLSANWKLLAPKLGLEPYAKEVGHMMRDTIKGTRGTGTIIVDIFNKHQTMVFDSMAGKRSEPSDFEVLKAELITRLELDKKAVSEGDHEVARHDALRCAIIIHGLTMKLFGRIDGGLKPADAERVKAAIVSVLMDSGRMAQSELEVAIFEWRFREYTADQENGLNPVEQRQFAAFLSKRRFTQNDFDALERFYSGPYDRLTERGKEELSQRFWAGTRKPK